MDIDLLNPKRTIRLSMTARLISPIPIPKNIIFNCLNFSDGQKYSSGLSGLIRRKSLSPFCTSGLAVPTKALLRKFFPLKAYSYTGKYENVPTSSPVC